MFAAVTFHGSNRTRLGVLRPALALAVLMGSTAARAATIDTSETLSIPLTPTNWSPGNPPSLGPLQFKKFDPALGTLNSVTLGLGATFQHDISLTFSSGSTLTEKATGSNIQVYPPAGVSSFVGVSLAPVSESRTETTGPYPKTITIPTIAQSATATPVKLSSPADLALFTALAAGDKIGLPVKANSNSEFSSSSGNGSGRIVTNAAANVTVTYNYTPIPEPSTLALVGLGAAVALAYNRRQAQARGR